MSFMLFMVKRFSRNRWRTQGEAHFLGAFPIHWARFSAPITMASPPTGTLTFCFTDIEGSSRLWERFPDSMGRALARHDALLRESAERHGGFVFKTVGDAFCIAFPNAREAVAAAIETQRALSKEPWETDALEVRMGLHTGAAEHRDGDYFGPALNRVARIMGAGHGGQTLVCNLTASLVRNALPEDVILRDLGEVRLRNLRDPERLFQLQAAGLRSDFPPLRSLVESPNNLPIQLTSFIGREREIAEVKRLVTGHRLTTLTGTGGTGKTRLLLRTASGMLGEFPGGVWLAELATLSDPDLLGQTVASAVGARERGDQSITDALADFLHDRQAALLLDNCEHLVEAVASLSQFLLRHCAKLRIVASSRAPLGIPGEALFPVPSLEMPDLWGLGRPRIVDPVAHFGRYEAVRLFTDRAATAVPGFSLNRANAETIARIIFRLDGIPHAIELAAARVKVLSPQQILERLDDRFRLLTGSRPGLPRQQTLRATIDWSYDLLPEPERALLRRLSVFGRGRTLEAIEAVCEGDPVESWSILDLLGNLVDRSLVTVEQDSLNVPRYFLLESLWDYARDKLDEAKETAPFRTRHLEYFVELAERLEPKLEGPDQARWIERIASERGNIRMAVSWSAEIPEGATLGLRLVTALNRYWEVRSHLGEGREHYRTVMERADPEERTLLRAKALEGAGRLAWCQDDTSSARKLYAAAEEIYGETGDEASAGRVLAFRGFVERSDGHSEVAADLFERALEIGESLSNPMVTAVARSGQGSLASDRGDYATARELKKEALVKYRKAGDRWVTGLVGWSLGRSAVDNGDFLEAAKLFDEFASIAGELGNRWSMPYVTEGFADIARGTGDAKQALTLYAAADYMRKDLGLIRPAAERIAHETALAEIRAKLSPDEFNEAWLNGESLSPEEAVAIARAVAVPVKA